MTTELELHANELVEILNSRVMQHCETLDRDIAKRCKERSCLSDEARVGMKTRGIRFLQEQKLSWLRALQNLADQKPIDIVSAYPDLKQLFAGWKPAVLEADRTQSNAKWARLAHDEDLFIWTKDSK